MQLSKERLEELTKDFKTPEQMESVYTQMLQHMINRALEAELTAHLGHAPHESSKDGNVRNGKHHKTVKSKHGVLRSRPRATEQARSSRSWWPNAKCGWPGWRTRFWRCMPAA